MGMAKSKWFVPAIVVGVILLLVALLSGSYNGLITSRENVKRSLGDLQSAYQRRSDLIPNLVNTVKGSSSFEQQTLTDVVNARAKATGITIDPANTSPEQLKAYVDAQNGVTGSLSKLLAVVESYPDIKSTQGYQELRVQLEGTENRINVARTDYNKVAQEYNTKIQRFPTNILAGIFGFKDYAYFEASAGAETVPTVNFGTN